MTNTPTPLPDDAALREVVENSIRHARMNAVMTEKYNHQVAEDNILLNTEAIMASIHTYTAAQVEEKVREARREGYNAGVASGIPLKDLSGVDRVARYTPPQTNPEKETKP